MMCILVSCQIQLRCYVFFFFVYGSLVCLLSKAGHNRSCSLNALNCNWDPNQTFRDDVRKDAIMADWGIAGNWVLSCNVFMVELVVVLVFDIPRDDCFKKSDDGTVKKTESLVIMRSRCIWIKKTKTDSVLTALGLFGLFLSHRSRHRSECLRCPEISTCSLLVCTKI